MTKKLIKYLNPTELRQMGARDYWHQGRPAYPNNPTYMEGYNAQKAALRPRP